MLLVAGLSLINLVVFAEFRRLEEESLYRLAYQHFLNYLQNPQHRGDEDFLINPPAEGGYKVYVFEDQGNPLRTIRVGVREELLKAKSDSLIKRLLIAEFFLVLALVFLYQSLIERYFTKVKEKEDWTRTLMLSLAHRLGNFMATQRVLLAMLKKSYPEDQNIKKLEKSLHKLERELSLFINPVREDKARKGEYLDLQEQVKEILTYFEEDLKGKRLILRLSSLYAYMNKEDLQDVLYNLVGNAIRHSSRLVHIKICSKRALLVIRNDRTYSGRHGMGMGVELTRKVLERYRFGLKISLKKNYTAFVQFKRLG